MAQINVSHLTFAYEGSFDNIFEDTSFLIDTDWKLGFVGRNGRGKTTFLKLLLKQMPYKGAIETPMDFEYFPFEIPKGMMQETTQDVMRALIAPYDDWEKQMLAASERGDMDAYGEAYDLFTANDGYEIDSRIETEAGQLGIRPEALSRPFATLSNGERTKAALAALFLKKNKYLLIDEPTNHLDTQGRRLLGQYLKRKSGFILVSHDRALLDEVVDHVLSINRAGITVRKGNFSTWEEEKRLQDEHEMARNEQLKTEIGRLEASTRRTAEWSNKIEASKFGADVPDRGFVGHQSARMMQRSKSIQNRNQRAIDEKEGLMKNLEAQVRLKIQPLPYIKKRILRVQDFTVDYGAGPLFSPVTFEVMEGQRVRIAGPNGCGKSSLIKLLAGEEIPHSGIVEAGRGLVVSYVEQDASGLSGDLMGYAQSHGVDETLFFTILRKFDFPRVQFEKDMADLSFGQKKKVLLARSLATQAHLYLWDEPLNYVDVLSRMHIEAMLLESSPAMLFVEHDSVFGDKVADDTVELAKPG